MAKRFVTRQKNCYCHTCARDIHYLGINSHRAAHRRRFEDCKITFTYGDTYTFAFSERRPIPRAVDGATLSAPDDTTGAFDESVIGSLP